MELDLYQRRLLFNMYFKKGIIEEIKKTEFQERINNLYGIDTPIEKSKELEELEQTKDILKYIYKDMKNLEFKKYRCKKRIEKITSNYENWKFITFTLNEKNIKKDKKYIEKKIKDTLNKFTDNWIFNEDIGTENERLHYHGVIGYNIIFDYKEMIEYYGLGAIKITSYKNNSKALTKYICKLTNHGFKGSTNLKIRYSRKKNI